MTQPHAEPLAVDVAIVGAGPSGLTAGYLLSRAGKSVVVIEKNPDYVGGIGRTVEQEGYRFDIGGHPFSSTNRAVLDLWNELLPDGFVECPRISRIYSEGKFYSWPPRTFEMVGNLGLRRSVACLASYLRSKLRPIRRAGSFEDWAINRFGRTPYATFIKAYTEKVWGIPCDQMSADGAGERMKQLRAAETFRYPLLGPGMVWEAARDRIVETGGAVLMGHALDQLASDGNGDWRLSAKGPGGQTVIRARHTISSAPLRELAARLHPLPESTWNASKLKYRDFITVALTVRAPDPFPDHRIDIHDARLKASRLRNLRSWSPAMAPDDAVACLGLDYFCFEGDDLWSMADQDLVALATSEIARLGLVSRALVLGGHVVRQEKAYPIHDRDYAANVAALRHELEVKYPTLHLVGGNGLHRYTDQAEAMVTAMLAVEAILAGDLRDGARRLAADRDDVAPTGLDSKGAESSSSAARRAA